MAGKEDPLAYGHYPDQEETQRGDGGRGERSLMGNTLRTFRDKYHSHSHPQQQQPYGQAGYPGQAPSQGYQQAFPQQQAPSGHPGQAPYGSPGQTSNPPYHDKPPKGDMVSGLLGKIQGIGSEIAQKIGTNLDPQGYAQYGPQGAQGNVKNRFGSFAPERSNSGAKWYVDGCSYMHAVSRALESAKESIWILDWWLSPELYLRRPPAKNEQYRLDRMLQAAAQRGVRVNIIVYKEVPQALTLSSSHTKHRLEELHPSIAVFRYPDHLPDRQTIQTSVISSFQSLTLNAAGMSKLSGDALKGVYGMSDGVILYWAHHEKLCLIDGKTAFMGGLDLCFGRWDMHQHSISDVHPTDSREIVFPGQDYNNPRILDFQDVAHWENNQLDRKVSPRMGWSDISVCLQGAVVGDLRKHFVDRWNFIFDQKYTVRQDVRYSKLAPHGQQPVPSASGPQPSISGSNYPQQQQQAQPLSHTTGGAANIPQTHQASPYSQTLPYGSQSHQQSASAYGSQPTGQQYPPPPPGPAPPQSTPQSGGYQQPQWSSSAPSPYQTPTPQPQASSQPQAPYFPPPPTQETQQTQTRALGGYDEGGYQQGHGHERGLGSDLRGLRQEVSNFGNILRGQLAGQVHHYHDAYLSGQPGKPLGKGANMSCQIVRSCTKWSHGVPTEHSIADAYAATIRNSEHFVYIENQFFITATSDAQKPVRNKIGAAIVERILRAARARQKYRIIVVIPSVPAFAGDLRDDASLGTRAIMEFQYNSINRGGNSIMETISKEGYNPMEYIRFYNLRNYDRINVSAAMIKAEQKSGVSYDPTRQQYDAGVGGRTSAFDTTASYQQYQQAAHEAAHSQPTGSGRWDTVSECYMLGGEDIRKVPWEHPGDLSEIDAFVSEELYVHSKVLIADDRTVICGSANLNDRSQLGEHDSEIAVIIEDPTPIESTMNGQPWPVSRFAATLRRQLCRKHLGLVRPQNYQRPDANSEPVGVPNEYDLNSPEDRVVTDPLSETFQSLWNSRARQNTEVFRQVFHAVPDDSVRNWNDYKEFYEYYFQKVGPDQGCKEGETKPVPKPARYLLGHVIRDDFPEGPAGVQAVKELLSKVKGTLVEMPLMFLVEEDIAKEGIGLNSLTEEVYT